MSGFFERLERSLRRRLQAPEDYRAWRQAQAVTRWEQAGRPVPPPHPIKVRIVLEYGRRFGVRTLVETGTYEGAMIDAVRTQFDSIHSVELAPTLYEAAAAKYAGDDAIHIHQGDSGEILAGVLAGIDTPVLFWLDGHFSEGFTALGTAHTPILRELEAVAAHPVHGHVILIDDARCFTGESDYPTLEALQALTGRMFPGAAFHVTDDVIRIHAAGASGG